MKSILLSITIVLSFGFVATDEKWTDVKTKTILDSQSALQYSSFDSNDPESVTVYFYACLLRKNDYWRKVCHKLESEWTTKMKQGMNTYSQYTFKKVRLLKQCRMFEQQHNFRIYLEVTKKGKPLKVSGEIILQLIEKKWTVIEVK